MPAEQALDEISPHESTGGIDAEAFGASIFEPSGPSDSNNGDVSSPELAATPEGSSPAPAALAEWDSLPKSWKQDMGETWKTATPEFRKYVYERENQMRDGISSYKSNATSWENATAPFKELMERYPEADSAKIMATLANNHVRIAQGSPEEKRSHLMALARGYGVDFEQARAAVDAQGVPAPVEGFTDAQLRILNDRFGPALRTIEDNSRFVDSQRTEAASKEVDKFFSDPKNEFVNEVADDILGLMKKGQVKDLSEAYEFAVMRNPAVKARYFASLAAAANPPASNASKLPNVKSAATPRNGSAKPQTIDETIAAVMSKYS